MRFLSTTLLISLFLLFQSCSEKDNECDVSCTEEYRTIVVNIINSEGEPVALDSFKVVDLRNGRDLSDEPDDQTFQIMRERGNYPVFSDKYVEDYMQEELQIKFTGFIEDVEVVSEIYKVGADCCHIYHVSGDLELVV